MTTHLVGINVSGGIVVGVAHDGNEVKCGVGTGDVS